MTQGHCRHLYREPNKFVLDKERPMIEGTEGSQGGDPGHRRDDVHPLREGMQRSNIWKPAAWSAFADGH